MDLDASLYWLALGVTPGLAARLTARLLRQFGSPEAVFHASLTALEACNLPAAVAQAIASQAPLKAAEKELTQVKRLGCRLLNWNEA
jgi:predicted Rossmann fold nucleotide-binding protein DprA/Smf involved in DNA uptake